MCQKIWIRYIHIFLVLVFNVVSLFLFLFFYVSNHVRLLLFLFLCCFILLACFCSFLMFSILLAFSSSCSCSNVFILLACSCSYFLILLTCSCSYALNLVSLFLFLFLCFQSCQLVLVIRKQKKYARLRDKDMGVFGIFSIRSFIFREQPIQFFFIVRLVKQTIVFFSVL